MSYSSGDGIDVALANERPKELVQDLHIQKVCQLNGIGLAVGMRMVWWLQCVHESCQDKIGGGGVLLGRI